MRRTLSACVLFCLAAYAPAADPMVKFQIQSPEQLHKKLRGTMELFMAMVPFMPDPADEPNGSPWAGIIGKKFPSDLFPGIDTKKPAVLYGNVDAGILKGDFQKCEAVLLLPVVKELDFIAGLKKYEVGAKPGEGGLYILSHPELPLPTYLRFHKGHAAVTVLDPKHIDPAKLPDPAALIDGKQARAASLAVRTDLVPAEIKNFLLEHLAEGIKEFKAEAGKELGAPGEVLLKHALPWFERVRKQVFDDSKSLTFNFDLDPATGETITQLLVEGRDGTPLKADIAAYKAPMNTFGSIAKADATMTQFLRLPLFAKEFRDLLSELIDETVKTIGNEDASPEGVEFVNQLLAQAKATVQSGKFDAAFWATAPDANNKLAALAGIRLVDADKLAPTIAKLVKSLPEEIQKMVKLNVAKAGGLSVHKVDLAGIIPVDGEAGKIRTIFGGDMNLCVALGKETVYLGFGADAENKLAELIAATPAVVPAVESTIFPKHALSTLAALGMPGEFAKGFQKLEKMKYLSLATDGGEKLKVELRSGMLMGFGGIGFAAQARFQAIPPPR